MHGLPARHPQPKLSAPEAGCTGPFLCVVVDEVITGEAIATPLRSRGDLTRVFCDPVLAHAGVAFAARKPDLLIADCTADRLKGLELAPKREQANP